MTQTPELERLYAVKEKSQVIGEFLEWLQHGREQRVLLAAWHEHTDGCYAESDVDRVGHTTCETNENFPVVLHVSINRLLAEYFKIDLDKVEREKLALLEEIRQGSPVTG